MPRLLTVAVPRCSDRVALCRHAAPALAPAPMPPWPWRISGRPRTLTYSSLFPSALLSLPLPPAMAAPYLLFVAVLSPLEAPQSR